MARSVTVNGDRIQNTSFNIGSVGTISIWIKPNWNSGDSIAHCFWGFGGGAGGITGDTPSFQKFSDNNIYAGFSGDTGEQRIIIADTGLFASGVWANWVLTWSAGAGEVLYKNGVSKGTHGAFTIPTLPAQVSAGNYDNASNAGSTNSNSAIADFAIWNVILSVGEISALAAGERPSNIRQTSLYWPLDGIQSPEPDLSGLAQNGTLTGTASAAGPPIALFTPRWPIPFLLADIPPILMGQAML